MPCLDPVRNRENCRRYYAAHPEAKEAAKRRTREYELRNIAYLREAKSKPCADCKQSYPYYVMDFDHLEDKTSTVLKLALRPVGLARLQEEIDKCEVVCSNCHRQRTFARGQMMTHDSQHMVAMV